MSVLFLKLHGVNCMFFVCPQKGFTVQQLAVDYFCLILCSQLHCHLFFMLNAYYYFKQANPSYTEDSLNEVTENQASSDVKPPFILCFGFNQIFTHFVVGTQRGYHVFSIKPFAHRAHMFFKQALTDSTSKPAEMVYGGIGIVEMLFRSNIFALVGGGPRPAFPPNKSNENSCFIYSYF